MSDVVVRRFVRVRLGRRTIAALVALLGAGICSVQVTGQQSSIPSSNVNVISGTGPDGDWTLQRQNEPSGACSSRNPQNCLIGANDYRTVDIPFPNDGGRVIGDAWLGWYTTKDGGQTWRTRLLPGFPQDTSPEGLASPLKGMEAGADPVVRSGANGMFFYAGITFTRGPGGGSRVFVARFVDNNDRERPDVESITYIDTKVIQSAPQGSVSNFFIDKPWLAVDIPREGARRCRIGGRSTGIARQTLPCARVYLAYTIFGGVEPNQRGTIMVASSDDSGATWSTPRPLVIDADVNDDGIINIADVNAVKMGNRQTCQTPSYNDGLDVNVDCVVNSRDANAVSALVGTTVASTVPSLHQGASIAISPLTGDVHLAFRQFRQAGTTDAIFAAKSTNGGQTYTAPVLVSTLNPLDQNTTNTSFRSNAFPSLAVDDTGRAYLAWTTRGLAPMRPDPMTGDARVVVATSPDGLAWSAPNPADNHAVPGHQIMPSLVFSSGQLQLLYYDQREDLSGLFGPFIDELPIITGPSPRIRHTTEVRAAHAAPGPQPVFESVRVSEYLFGVQPGSSVSTQLQFHPPNLPLFRLGTAPFMGDYIEIIPAQPIVPSGNGFVFNTAPAQSPLFHAIWTDNRDVRPPPDGDWTKYTPPNPSFARPTTSAFDPSQTIPECQPGFVATRNQNIYTARVTGGLVVGALTNAKQLGVIPRSFPIYVQNATTVRRSYRLTIRTQPVGGRASFDQFALLTTIDVQVPARSTIARSVHATSTDARASVPVDIVEITAPGGTPIPAGQSAEILLNPDPTNPDVDNPDVDNPDVDNPDVDNPDVDNAEVYNPDVDNGAVLGLANPDVDNPDVDNPDVDNVLVVNPSILTADPSNPDVDNPDVDNPDVDNPDVDNADLVNGGLTDTTWTMTNRGNTAASYAVKMLLNRALPPGFRSQLIVHRIYQTPSVQGCELKQQTQNVLLVNLPNPAFATGAEVANPDVDNPDVDNVTVAIPPGASIQVTLRVFDPNRFDAQTFDAVTAVTPAMVAHSVDTASVAVGDTTPTVAAPLLPPPDLPAAPVGSAYSFTLPSVGPGTWSVVGGSLPTGLVLNPTTGEITGVATAGGEFTFVVRFVNSDGLEDFQTVTLNVAAPEVFADLALSMNAAPDPVVLGAPLTYTVTVSNNGPAAASGVDVAQSIPVGATFVSATPSQGTCTSGTSVQCTIGSLAGGATTSIVVVMTPGSAGFASSTASVASSVADGVPVNNTANAVTLVQAFASCSTLTLSGPRIVDVPAEETFQFALDDFTGDGLADAVSSHTVSNELSLLPGDGDGNFGPPTTIPLAVSPQGFALGDFNKDGNTDVAVATFSATSLTSLLGNGAGGFTPGSPIAVGLTSFTVEAGDFNHDGNLDLLVGGENGGMAFVAGRGDGSFDPAVTESIGTGLVQFAVEDYNLDGHLDAVASDQQAGAISLRLGDGTGAFTPGTSFAPGAPASVRKLGDVNLDGNPDFAVTRGPAFAQQTLIFLGDGASGFAAAMDAGTDATGHFVAAGDVTGDGLPDLVTLHSGAGFVSLQVGDGTSFGPPVRFAVPLARHVGVADVNGDQRPDVIVVSGGSPARLSVLLNTCGASPADLVVTASDAPDPIVAGGSVTYSVTVSNDGPNPSTSTQVTAALPLNAPVFASATSSQGTCSFNGQLATCDVGTLANGASATLTLTATGGVGGSTFRATIGATADQADPDPATNAETLATTVIAAGLVSIEVTPANPTILQGATQQFTATGTFSDTSTQDITSTVTWSSSNVSVATISNGEGAEGLATGVGGGVTTITATAGIISGATSLTVTGTTPVINDVTPDTGQQGGALSVDVIAEFTNFAQGQTNVSFGAGITVTDLTITSATTATVGISISPTTTVGARDVTFTTGGEIVTRSGGFTVTAGTAALVQIAPATGDQGQTLAVDITGDGTHFAQGVTTVGFSRTPQTGTITPLAVTVNGPTSLTAQLSISANASAGFWTVSVITAGEVTTLANAFTVNATLPTIADVVPSTGQQGQTLDVVVTGQLTSFVEGQTTANFGTGIDVNDVTVTTATSATVNLTIQPVASIGPRTVQLTTGTETVSLTNGFTVTSGPAIVTDVQPNVAEQGQSLVVAVSGQDTHFEQDVTVATFGPDITVNALTVTSPTTANADITVSPLASPVARTVTLTTLGEQASITNGFAVTAAGPVVTAANPSSAQQGATSLNVAVTGQFTNFVDGQTTADFGAGITENTVSVTTATTASVNITISPLAAIGNRTVTMTTGGEVAAGPGIFSVTAGPATLTTLQPAGGEQGETLAVTITGTDTHFEQGVTTATFGGDISVLTLTVNSPTEAVANISIGATAAVGLRDVTLNTQGEAAGIVNGFTVLAATPVVISVTPGSGRQGEQMPVTVVGQLTNFAQGVTVADFGAGVVIDSLTVLNPTSATVNISIDPITPTGSRAVQMTTGSEVATGGSFLIVAGTAVLTQISPNSADQGQTVAVAVTGQNTHFAAGVTTASVSGGGVTAGEVNVTSATTASVSLTVQPLATPGPRTVTLHTSGESASLVDGFTVVAATPTITLANPNAGQQGQTLDVVVAGQFTNFQQGITTAGFGAGIIVNGVTVTSLTSATVNITIDPIAFVGGRIVTLTTGTEIASSVANAFTVQAGPASLVSLTPNTGRQGETFDVAVTGQGTHFAQGLTTATLGPSIAVNQLLITSPTTATANVSVLASAPTGTRTVVMTTGGELAQLADGFTVTAGLARIAAVNPATGRQAEALSVSVTGEFTAFQQSVTSASFGPGIVVNAVTVTAATSATIDIAIDAAAAPGSRTVTLTTGGEVAESVGGFTVLAGLPQLLSVNPTVGTQGQSPTVVLTGQFTNFESDVTIANFGSGISVGTVTVNGPTLASVPITITAGAVVGPRTVTVTTGSQVVSLTNGFTVLAGTPALSIIEPNVGRPNENITVSISGEFTNFSQGVTVASFGPDVSVGGAAAGALGPVTVSSATTLTASLAIATGAQLGPREVVVQTGSETLSVVGGFTITDVESIPPTVFKVSPASGADDVPLNAQVQVEFSEPIDRTSVTADSFALRDNTTFLTIPATRSVDVTGRIATLIPSQLLAVNRSYSVLLSQSGAIRDASGNAMPFQSPAAFTTGFTTDTTGPALVVISPASAAGDVPLNADIVLQFSKPLNPLSQAVGVQVESNGSPLPGTFTFSAQNTILTFQPTSLLAVTSEYNVVLTEQLVDAAGNVLANPGTFAFTTGTVSDTAAPLLVASNPESGATQVGVNTVMRAVFNERIDPISVGTTGFATLVHAPTGTTWPSVVEIAADRRSLTLTPAVPLLGNTQYTFRTSNLRDLTGLPGAHLAASFTTSSGADAIAPAVTHIAPQDGATDVPVNARVIVRMSEPVDPTSVAGALQLTPSVAGTLTLSTDERTLTLVPNDPLAVSTSYAVALSGLRDLAGNAMSPFASTFTTRVVATADTTPPAVTLITPAAGAVVAVTTPIVITVSEPIVAGAVDVNSVRVFALANGSNVQIPGTYTVNPAATEITFDPLTPYPGSTTITVHVNSTSTIRDLAGNNLTFMVRSFNTVADADTTPPGVLAVMPVAGSVNVGLNTEVTFTFSEPLDPSTVAPTTFKLFAGTEQLGTSVQRSIDNRTVVLSAFLPPQSLITAVATSGVTDLSGNALADFTSTFTTTTALDTTTAQVVTMRPGNGAASVPATTPITLYVSEALQPDSVPSSLWVAQNGTLVTGTITLSGSGTAIQFAPTAPFAAGAFVQVFLEGTLDQAGHTVPGFQASFTIAADPATTAGTILRVAPSGNDVPLNPIVEIEVSEPVDPDSVTAATVRLLDASFQTVPTTISLRAGGRIIRLVPAASLAATQTYFVQVLAGLLDVQQQPIPGTFTSFVTSTELDEAGPTVDAVTPLDGSTDLGINALVRVRFNEPINPLSVTGATIQVTAGAFVAVPATIGFNSTNTEVTITPVQPLPDATTVTIAVAGVQDRAGHDVTPLATTFATATGADTRGPTLTGASVFSGQTDVPVNSVFIGEFDELLDPQSVTAQSVFVRDNLTFVPVPATVTLQPDGRTIVVAPTAPLAVNRSHSLLFGISGTLRDLAGNSATSAQLFFITSFQPDATAPNVVATNPINGDLSVPTNVILRVLFDEPIDVESLKAISLNAGSAIPVTAALANGNRTVTISPPGLLSPGTSHTLGLVGVRDTSGNQMAPLTITFVTGPGADLITPAVVSANPHFGATDVGLNAVMRVVFSERIDPISLTTGLVRLLHSGTGTVTPTSVSLAADRRSLTLTPTAPLRGDTQYTFQVSNLRDLAGNAGASISVTFTTAAAIDAAPPSVVHIAPSDGAADVPVNARVIIRMNEPIDPTSVTGALQLTPGVSGLATLSADGQTLTLLPTLPLTLSTTYTVALTGLRDLTGNTMLPFASTFTTRANAAADTTPPTVVSTTPPGGASGVAVNSPLIVNVSEPIVAAAVDVNSVRVFALVNGSNVQVAGTYSVNAAATTFTFTPVGPYPSSSTITVQINSNGAIDDLAGNNLTFVSLQFTTAADADTTAPTVLAVTPVEGTVNVGLNTQVTLTFSESLAPATVTTTTFELFAGAQQLNAGVTRSVDNRSVMLTASLPPAALITVIVTSQVTDLSGNALEDFTSTFTTGPAVDTTTAQVVTVRPGSGATGVPPTTPITLFLSEPVQPDSVPAALWVAQNGTLVTGTITVSGDGTAIQFVPTVPFAGSAFVEVFLEGVRDAAGHTVPSFQASFTIAADPATSNGTILRVSPSGTDVPLNPVVEFEVSEPVNPDTVTAATVRLLDASFQVVPTVISPQPGNRVFRLALDEPVTSLTANQTYFVQVLAGLLDLQGQPVSGAFTSFVTGTTLDADGPTVQAVTPPAGSTDIGINAQLRVRFNEPVNPITVTGTTIQVTAGPFVAMPATISFDATNTEVTITPVQALPDATVLTVAVAGVEDRAGHSVTPLTTTFTTRTGADVRGPILTGASVFPGQTDVPVNSVFIAEFDELLDPQSVTTLSALLRDNTTFLAVPATVTLQPDGQTIILAPTATLAVNRSYSLLFSSSGTVRDLAGNSATSVQLFFTTSSASDTTPPTVVATVPVGGFAGVPINTRLEVLFNEPVNPTSLDQVQLTVGGSPLAVTRTLTNGNRTLTLTPATLLAPATAHTMSITAVRDTAGSLLLGTTEATFTTAAGADFIRPAVSAFLPSTGTIGVPVAVSPQVTFTEAISPLSVSGNIVLRLTNTGTIVPVTYSFSADFRTVILTPATQLAPATQYTIAVINTNVRDFAGNTITSTSSAVFTTQ